MIEGGVTNGTIALRNLRAQIEALEAAR